MTRFWWVRHGPTHEKTFVGWRDVPADLSDHTAIDRLNAYLPRKALLISSDLIRSTATADAIQGHRTRLPHDPGLREFNFGDWDGLAFGEVAEQYPDLSRAYWEHPGDTAPPNGESWNQAETRVNTVVSRLSANHPDQDIVVVAHIGVIMTQIRSALRLSTKDAIAQKIDNLSVTCISGPKADPINHIP